MTSQTAKLFISIMLTQVISNFRFFTTNIINMVAVKAYRVGYITVTQSGI